MTTLEIMMLSNIGDNPSSIGFNNWIFKDATNQGPFGEMIPPRSIPGVMSGLKRKQLIEHEGRGRNRIVRLTPAGVREYRRHYPGGGKCK